MYNAEEIKNELMAHGFEFSEHTDDEIVLKAFIHFGYDLVNKLNGVFSFAIWNENAKELFLARDRFGIKPLYYTLVDNILIFASEVKSILKFPIVPTELNIDSISELFGLGPAHTSGLRSLQKYI